MWWRVLKAGGNEEICCRKNKTKGLGRIRSQMIAMCEKNLACTQRWLSVIPDSEHCEGVTLGYWLTTPLTDSSNTYWHTSLPFSSQIVTSPNLCGTTTNSLSPNSHDARGFESAIELYNQPRLMWTYIVHLIQYGDAVVCPPVSSPGLLLFNSSWVV